MMSDNVRKLEYPTMSDISDNVLTTASESVKSCGVMVNGTILLLMENSDHLLVLEDFNHTQTINIGFTAGK